MALHTITTPEEHRQRFLVAKEIISNARLRLQAAIQGEKHNFLFEKANSQTKGDLRYIFNAIDLDHSERISIQELRGYLEQVGKPIKDSELKLLFKSMDSDHNNFIDFEEFGELILRYRQLMSRYDQFVTYFIPIDANQDDLISASEMNIAMASVGEPPLTSAEILFIRNLLGRQQSLTWNQFLELLLVI